MKKHELNLNTLSDLGNGTVFTAENGRRVIIGDTDTVAFDNADGGWQIAESVFWNNIEDLTDDELLGHLLTAADFVEDAHGSLLYIGPLYPAMQFIKNNNEVDGPNRHILTGKWTVKLDGGNVWGTADTAEMAWRYAIGAEFGPLDEGFSPFRLK